MAYTDYSSYRYRGEISALADACCNCFAKFDRIERVRRFLDERCCSTQGVQPGQRKQSSVGDILCECISPSLAPNTSGTIACRKLELAAGAYLSICAFSCP